MTPRKSATISFLAVVLAGALAFSAAGPEVDGLICHLRKGNSASYGGVMLQVPLRNKFIVDNTGINVNLDRGWLRSKLFGASFGYLLMLRVDNAGHPWSVEGVRAMQQKYGRRATGERTIQTATSTYHCVESENGAVVQVWCLNNADPTMPAAHFFGASNGLPEFYQILLSAKLTP